MNSGETRHSRPSDPVSPRRDLQGQILARARAFAHAEGLRFERGTISLRREMLEVQLQPRRGTSPLGEEWARSSEGGLA